MPGICSLNLLRGGLEIGTVELREKCPILKRVLFFYVGPFDESCLNKPFSSFIGEPFALKLLRPQYPRS